MSDSKHTPGPWVIGYRPNLVLGPRRGTVAHCAFTNTGSLYRKVPTPDESCANARLIAAAPDLLEACSAWIEYLDRDGDGGTFEEEEDIQDAMRAAIAKATAQDLVERPPIEQMRA